MPVQVLNLGDVVLYTKTAGSAGEIQVPETGTNLTQLPAGGPVLAAWYVPTDSLQHLTTMTSIQCVPDGNHVRVVVGGRTGHPEGRLRITIYAEVDT